MRENNWNVGGTLLLLLMMTLCAIAAWTFFYGDYAELPENEIANISLDLFGMIICTIIFASTIIDHRMNPSTIIFMCLLTMEILILFWDIEGWIIDGNPEYVRFNKILNYYGYGLMLIILGTYWLYLKELYVHERKTMDRWGRWVLLIFTIGIILILSNPFTEIYFTIDSVTGEYQRSSTYFISFIPGYAMVMFSIYSILKFEHRKRRKAVLLSYIFIPIVATVVQLFFYGVSLQSVSIMFSLTLVYANIYIDRSSELVKNETQMSEQRAAVMISQIQPHFLYNALTSIMNIKGNPMETREAIADFGKYMRSNLDSITQTNPIQIRMEIDQVETYVNLRKMKFGDRLDFSYKIEDANFFIPPQTIRNIVAKIININLHPEKSGLRLEILCTQDETDHIVRIKSSSPCPSAREFINDHDNEEIRNMRIRLKNMVDGTIDSYISGDDEIITSIRIPLNRRQSK